MHGHRTLLTLLLVAGLLFGCSAESEPAPGDGSASAPAPVVGEAATVEPASLEPGTPESEYAPVGVGEVAPAGGGVGTDIAIELVDPGAEPRRRLRFRFTAGDVQEFRASVVTLIDTVTERPGLAAIDPTNSEPEKVSMEMRLVMGMRSEITSVDEDGTAAVTITLPEFEMSMDTGDEAPPGMVDQIRAMLEPIKEVRYEARVTARGTMENLELKGAEGLPPVARQQAEELTKTLKQFSAQVPDEPIGVGAVWSIRGQVRSNGLIVEQTGTATLVALDDDAFEQEFDLAQALVGTDGRLPNVDVEMSGAGKGRTRQRFDQLRPETMTMDLDTEMRMTSKEPDGARNAMTMKMKLRVPAE